MQGLSSKQEITCKNGVFCLFPWLWMMMMLNDHLDPMSIQFVRVGSFSLFQLITAEQKAFQFHYSNSKTFVVQYFLLISTKTCFSLLDIHSRLRSNARYSSEGKISHTKKKNQISVFERAREEIWSGKFSKIELKCTRRSFQTFNSINRECWEDFQQLSDSIFGFFFAPSLTQSMVDDCSQLFQRRKKKVHISSRVSRVLWVAKKCNFNMNFNLQILLSHQEPTKWAFLESNISMNLNNIIELNLIM